MSQKRLWVAAAIIGLVIILGFILSVPHTRDLPRPPEESEAKVVAIPTVTLHDAYKKGTHTITGSLLAPNACGTVSAQASLAGEGIVVAITLSTDSEVCLELPTRINFSTTIAAPAQLPISASVNGSAATTTAL
jgi:hypothetical protein